MRIETQSNIAIGLRKASQLHQQQLINLRYFSAHSSTSLFANLRSNYFIERYLFCNLLLNKKMV